MTLYFLNRSRTLSPCTLVKSSDHYRTVRVTYGDGEEREVRLHPEGVAWNNLYPRLFETDQENPEVFIHGGRAILVYPESDGPVPEVISHYRFQDFIKDVIDCVHARENTLLTGGTGVGKTTHIDQLAARARRPVMRINFNGETRMSDLIGKVSVVGGETRWCDGVVPMAMRLGYWLLLDELDFAEPAVLSLLHPVLEPNPTLVLKENGGEVVKAHPDFRVFATANSVGSMQDRAHSYTGTNTMNEAFLDRWNVIHVSPISESEELRVVRGEAPGLQAKVAKGIVEFASLMRDKDRVQKANLSFVEDSFSTRRVIAWAKKTALHRDAVTGARLAWLGKYPSSDQEVLVRLLETFFPKERRKREDRVQVRKVRRRKKDTVSAAGSNLDYILDDTDGFA